MLPSERTHRDLTRIAARWLLDCPGIYAASYEVAFDGGQADALGVSTPDPRAEVELRCNEYRNAGIRAATRDGFPAEDPEWLPRYRAGALKRHGARPRVVVVECKRTRADLQADLRAGKLRRYEVAATHCWLLATDEALAAGRAPRGSRYRAGGDPYDAATLHRLRAEGLPDSWGVLTLPAGSQVPHELRDARRLRTVEGWEVRAWADRMLASMCYRVVRGRSPMADEAESLTESSGV